MMKNLFLAISCLLAGSAALAAPGGGWSKRIIQGVVTDGITTTQNLIKNAGFESATANWTASGGTFTSSPTAVGTGTAGGDWDSSAASQTLTSDAFTIPNGLTGHNAVVSCNIKCVSGTCTHTIAAFDGTTAINPTTIASNTTAFTRTSANFIMPSSGTIAVQVKSVASNEPEIYVDDCFISDASLVNIGSVALATDWVSYTPVLSAGFGTVTNNVAYWRRVGDTLQVRGSCTIGTRAAVIMSVSLPPGQVIDSSKISTPSGTTSTNNEWGGTLYQDGSSAIFQMIPATGTSTSVMYVSGQSSTGGAGGVLEPAAGTSGGLFSSAFTTYSFSVPILGWTANGGAYRPEATPASYSGSFTTTGCSTTSTSLADIVNCSGATLTARATPRNITCSVASSELGISCALPRSGNYLVFGSTWGTVSAGANINTRITDGSGTVIGTAGDLTLTIGNNGAQSVQGVYNAASAGTYTFKFQARVSSGTLTFGNSTAGSTAEFQIVEIDAPLPAPYLTGSVTSNTSGQERVERARILNNGTCSIGSQSGSWLTSVTHGSLCHCALVWPASTWSAAPTCVATAESGDWAYISSAATTTGATTCTESPSAGGTNVDDNYNLICMGPR